MKQVKGSMVKLPVKSARANKTGIYQEKLSEKALELLDQRILDAAWYPFELYKELLNAVADIDGKNSPKALFKWGQRYGEVLMTSIYRRTVSVDDIHEAIAKYQSFHKQVYNFGSIKEEFLSDNELIASYVDFERDWECFYHIAFGWLQKFLELCLSKEVAYAFVSKSWESEKDTSFRFQW